MVQLLTPQLFAQDPQLVLLVGHHLFLPVVKPVQLVLQEFQVSEVFQVHLVLGWRDQGVGGVGLTSFSRTVCISKQGVGVGARLRSSNRQQAATGNRQQ